jgi:glycosyltransferase involved in cell wall biosynthesis
MPIDNNTIGGSSVSVSGALDGRTIVRFAHAYSAGGGVERYLDYLDSSLLVRNAMTVVRIFVGSSEQSSGSTENIGRGTLVKVPLPLAGGDVRRGGRAAAERGGGRFRILFRNLVLYNPAVWSCYTKQWLNTWKLPARPGEVDGAGLAVRSIYQRRKVDLAMLHFFGGSDAGEIIDESLVAGIPYALLNHFSNDRFLNLAIRKHVMNASGVSGVSGILVPRYLNSEFCDLSDGIDVGFFQTANGDAQRLPLQLPLVLLPARIVRSKGHLDLIKAVAILKKGGLDCNVGFVGRAGTPDFDRELRNEVGVAQLNDRVHFLGELSVGGLRNWYKTATVVAFPTYHHEGLPRVLLEAQAMRVPVVAYSTGGTSGGMVAGKTGFLLETGDVDGLAAKLRIVLENNSLRAAMGIEGEKLVHAQFSLSALAERHERFYLRVISRGMAPR